MKAFILFKSLLILSCLIFNTEAELSLTLISPLEESTINGLNIPKNVECNAAVTFVCEIKPYIDSVIWQINGHTYALCFFDECRTYPPFPENHNITMDLENEDFNLTVSSVTNATNNNIYKCDDGITARSVKATVNVYPTSESLRIDESAEDRITVTTGCVYPNGVNDVTFEWFITKSNTTSDPESFTLQKDNSTVIFDCTEMPTCTVEETSHFNNTVIFDVSDEGEEYYFFVSVKHKSSMSRPSAVLSTERRYKVKNKVIDVKICPIYCPFNIIISIICAVHVLFCLQTFYLRCILYKTIPKNGLKHSTDENKTMAFLVGIPFVGFVLPMKTSRREVKQEEYDSMKYCIIGLSVLLTLIVPAVWMCLTSILFLRSHEVTLAKYWKFIMLLIIGCLIVFCIEVVLLIQCEVFCWDKIIYVPFTTLYFVMLWIYMTVTVVRVKYLLRTEEQRVFIDVCNTCGMCASYQCKTCKELMCKDCVLSHKKHITEIKNQREEDNKFLCKSCCTLVVNSYCMTCETFLCVRCVKYHGKSRHDLLRHQQHNEDREREFCCDSCKEAGNHISAAHAFCLTCRAYLCTWCLKTKHKTCTLLWIQKQRDKVRERVCCEEIKDHTELPLEGVCLTCESYICTRCLENPKEHRTHHVASHQQEHNFPRASSRFLCKGCERLPVECYNLHINEFLCAKCFENGHKSSKRKQKYTNSNILLLKHQILSKISPCQIHTVLGDASPSHVEVYCLECQIYMCRICFFRHRRIAEFWIKSQKGNLFYCKICKTDEHVYPVECCNIETGEYMCANCYECVEHFITRKYAAGQSKDVRKKTSDLRELALPCQIHQFPFNEQEKEVPGSVYCLVCKLYLCKHCFELHRRLKYVWQKEQEHGAKVPFEASTDVISKNNIIHVAKHSEERIKSYQVSKTNIGLMVWWHFPPVGIGIAFFHWCCQCMRDQRQVNPKYRER